MAKRILVVDDDPNIRRLVTMALMEDSSYIVNDVSSAEAALLHISRQPVDLLFTDIRMPGMDGLELVRRVHELDPQTSVIVFTVSPQDLTPKRAAELKIDCLLEKPVEAEKLRLAVDLLLNPTTLLPTGDKAPPLMAVPPPAPHPQPAVRPGTGSLAQPQQGTGPLNQRLAQAQQRRASGSPSAAPTVPAPAPAPIAMRITPGGRGDSRRTYSDQQIEDMRQALKDLVLSPDVHCALLADTSGMVLTHWSRYRDINVTVVAALAAGNSLAMSEISRNLGQRQPGHLVIQEGHDQSILMAQMEDLLLLLAVGPNASLGWARIATLRACEEVVRIVHRSA